MALLRTASTRQLAHLIPRLPRPLARTLTASAPALHTARQRAPTREPKPNASRSRLQNGQRGGQKPKKLVAPRQPIKLKPESLPRTISSRLDGWTRLPRVAIRLKDYGFSNAEAKPTLADWLARSSGELEVLDTSSATLLDDIAALGWDPQALTLAYESGDYVAAFETAFMRHFLEYATASGPQHLRLHLRSILEATDISSLAQTFTAARSVSRHFHLHMGPTNSGKTYNALKALSKAGTGVYAGPLRLLAHEVWERVNLGTVGEMDGKGRACNLLTGEERRIVEPDAGIVACTVEMLPINGNGGESWDVVVVDEIQMLGDEARGMAWTSAVMGVNAKEVHLCGDETTAELLKSMIGSFKGDTLTVHRYDRLTPLRVEDESLDGDWKKVRPGDCIVTFSRSNVFSVKKLVEGSLGKKCAVVYGALPPETRAEQARDFNEDGGRAEVLVASDAVGMGLNLKIGRIIFESLSKWNGKSEVPLSLSQVKQIAGRAGRFGQGRKVAGNTDEQPSQGGGVTTLNTEDLPLLRAMLSLPLPAIPRAVVSPPLSSLVALAPLLPPDVTFADLTSHFEQLAKVPPNTVLGESRQRLQIAELIEPARDVLTLSEADSFSLAPLNVRDPKLVDIFQSMVTGYADSYYVELEDVLESSELLDMLDEVEAAMAALPPLPPHASASKPYLAPPIAVRSIPSLETLHKSLVLYIWLSYRLELGFPDRELAMEYKARTEKVLDLCLQRLPGVKNKHGKGGVVHQHKLEEAVKPDIKWEQSEAVAAERRRHRWRDVGLVDETK
ncbi:RNA helicase [Vanrija albida]|uniref:RNA helicase n=1 Tax=Vanrija albida TaxID=181172 RepID=A0ABR3Q0Z0_9TREE